MDNADILEGPGFRMERHGRFIESIVDRSSEEQEELISRLAAAVPRIRADLAMLVQKIETQLVKFDTFTVLGALSLINHLLDPETYQENTHKGESVIPEYAALLTLKHSYSPGSEIYVSSDALNELQTDLQEAFQTTAWLHIALDAAKAIEAGRGSDSPTELEKLQFMMRSHELGVRNPAYQHHHHEVLRGLFKPFESTLVSALGFSVEDAIQMGGAIPRWMNQRIYNRIQEANRQAKMMETAANLARKDKLKISSLGTPMGGEQESIEVDVIDRLSEMSPKSAKQVLKGLAAEWTLIAADDICSFTAEAFAEDIGVDAGKIIAYCAAFQIEFGDIPAEYVEFSATHPLRSHPIIHHEGRYICPAPMLLDWAIQARFEAALKSGGDKGWQRYQKHRHDWLLDTSVQLLQQMMPSADFAQNLLYDESGDRAKEAELDALGHYDTTAFLIEVKGADVTEPARRGAPDRLRRDLYKVIRDSHAQAVRAKAYLSVGGEIRFRRASGGPDVVLAPSAVNEVMLLSVSLAPLGHLTSLLHADSELGLFTEGEYSWVVSIYDLMVIAEIIDLPAVFPHYVRRRVHAAHMGVLEAHDELDIFGYYLTEGLYLDDVVAEMRAKSDGREVSINLLSFTNPIDAYIFHKIGAREKRAPKPAQRMHPKLRSLLERIEQSGLPGRLEVAMRILDLDEQSRSEFLKYVERARKIARRERRLSNGSMVGGHKDRWGLTYVCGLDEDELNRALSPYCQRKHDEHRTRSWIGFAELIGPKPDVIGIRTLRRP